MRCAIRQCDGMPVPDAPVELCASHLAQAHDWVARDVGVTDLLPSPCLACGSRLGARYPSGWLCAICEWRVGDIPDETGIDSRVDVVYYLRAGERIKIGTSGSPRSRLAALHWDQLLAFERGGRGLEQQRHARFASLRYPGSEWFRAGDELLAHVGALAADGLDPWDLYARWVSERIALGRE